MEAQPWRTPLSAKLSLTSNAFQDGQPIPMQYTCDGRDQTPALSWGEPPRRTKSFALVIDDPDAPSGTFRHWGVFDIPASARSIGGGQRIGTEVTNDFGKIGYGGPCPPKGHGPHHYHFKLFALDVDRLGVEAGARIEDVEAAAQEHALGQSRADRHVRAEVIQFGSKLVRPERSREAAQSRALGTTAEQTPLRLRSGRTRLAPGSPPPDLLDELERFGRERRLRHIAVPFVHPLVEPWSRPAIISGVATAVNGASSACHSS